MRELQAFDVRGLCPQGLQVLTGKFKPLRNSSCSHVSPTMLVGGEAPRRPGDMPEILAESGCEAAGARLGPSSSWAGEVSWLHLLRPIFRAFPSSPRPRASVQDVITAFELGA